MEGYLGEEEVDIKNTEYAEYSQTDWILLWLSMYSGIDGAHHKQWLLDQIARISLNTKVCLKIAKWENGYKEERFYLGAPSDQYHEWKHGMSDGGLFDYDCGIAP